jgi:hypothetical protein
MGGKQCTHYKGYNFRTIMDKGPSTKFKKPKSKCGRANLFNF